MNAERSFVLIPQGIPLINHNLSPLLLPPPPICQWLHPCRYLRYRVETHRRYISPDFIPTNELRETFTRSFKEPASPHLKLERAAYYSYYTARVGENKAESDIIHCLIDLLQRSDNLFMFRIIKLIQLDRFHESILIYSLMDKVCNLLFHLLFNFTSLEEFCNSIFKLLRACEIYKTFNRTFFIKKTLRASEPFH